MFGSGRKAPRMSGSGRIVLPDVWGGQEALSVVQEWSGDPSECPGCHTGFPGVVGRPSLMSGRGQETFPNNREWLGGPPGCPGVVGRPSWMSGSGWESLQEVWEVLWMSGSCRETLLDVRELLGDSPRCP